MNKENIKKIGIAITILASSLLFANQVFADVINLPNPLCLNNGANNTPCVRNLEAFITQITNYITGIIAALAVIMFVWAGVLFVVSAGDQSKINQAKQIVIWAVIGVAIVLAAQLILAVVTAVIGAPTP